MKWRWGPLLLGLGACAPTSPVPERLSVSARRAAIVGGTEAPEDSAVVALVARRVRCAGESLTPLCSGAVIAPDVVLTAAHCLELFGPEGAYEVFLGARLPEDAGAAGRFVRVARAVRHPAHVPGTSTWDVALLRLASPVDVRPLPLPEARGDGLRPGQALRAVGFGDTKDAALAPGVRRQGDLRVTELGPGMDSFRAGPAPAMSCVGDSGGPVLARDAGGQEVLVGVTVSGDFACRTEAVQVRVAAVRASFLQPFLEAPPAPGGPVLDPGALCAAPCTQSDACPAGLSCEEGRCLLPALQAGDYGAACTADARCGAQGLCARLESDGPDACRCFTSCESPPPPDLPGERGGGCAGTPGLMPGLGTALAAALLRRRGTLSAGRRPRGNPRRWSGPGRSRRAPRPPHA